MTEFSLRFRARSECGSLLRAGLREWLEEVGVRDEEIFDFQLACCEALYLAIGRDWRPLTLIVEVRGRVVDGVVKLSVRDYGLTRATCELDEGLGVALLRGMMDRVDVNAHADGYSIMFERKVGAATRRRATPEPDLGLSAALASLQDQRDPVAGRPVSG